MYDQPVMPSDSWRGYEPASMCIWIFPNAFIKGIENELVAIPITDDIADDSPVAQIKDCTQIELVNN